MTDSKTSIKLSVYVCAIVSVLLAILVLFAPSLFDLYMSNFRGFAIDSEKIIMLKKVFIICFYPCSVFAAVILYSLFKILFNIKNGEVFIVKNSMHLRAITICLTVIGLITFAGGFFYMPMMFVSAAGLFTAMFSHVLKSLYKSAVELREENDLTI